MPSARAGLLPRQTDVVQDGARAELLPAHESRSRTRTSRPRGPFPIDDADILRIPVGPGSLHVERYGRGWSPVVLLHGFGTSSFLWRQLAPALAENRHTAFAIDLLGYGESDRPLDAEYGIAAQAEYLDRALTGLRIARATLVGIDLGGAVALRLAATRPERVDRLILINPIGFDDIPARDIKMLQRSVARVALRVARGVMGVTPLLTPLLEGSVISLDHMPPRLQGRYIAPYVGQDGVGHLLALSRSVQPEDLEGLDPGTITQPTLIIWGEADQWITHTLPDRFAEAIPHGQAIRLPRAARLVPEEAPEELASAVIDFAADHK